MKINGNGTLKLPNYKYGSDNRGKDAGGYGSEKNNLKLPNYSWGADNRGKEVGTPGYCEYDGQISESKLSLKDASKN